MINTPLAFRALIPWRRLLDALWPRPVWSDRIAKNLLGKVLLIGMTRVTADNELIDQKQMYGRVMEADPKRGILIRLLGSRFGEDYWLPPDLRPLKRAPAGEYRLRSTGETVRDPDFLCNWTAQASRSVETK